MALVALSITAKIDTLTPIEDDHLLDRIYRYQLCPRGLAPPEEYTPHCFFGPWPAQREGYESWIRELERISTPPI